MIGDRPGFDNEGGEGVTRRTSNLTATLRRLAPCFRAQRCLETPREHNESTMRDEARRIAVNIARQLIKFAPGTSPTACDLLAQHAVRAYPLPRAGLAANQRRLKRTEALAGAGELTHRGCWSGFPRSPQSWTPKTVPGLTDRRCLGGNIGCSRWLKRLKNAPCVCVFRQMAKVWGAMAFGQHFGLVIRR